MGISLCLSQSFISLCGTGGGFAFALELVKGLRGRGEFCLTYISIFFVYFFGGLECVGHFFAYVAHFVFLEDVWCRTQRANRRATNLATHLPDVATHLPA